MKKTILITGGAGFVGSNLALSFIKKYPSLSIIVLDNLKRRGSELNLPRLKEAGIHFLHGDIRNPEDLVTEPFDVLLECSAEPSVLAGFGESPAYVINTNLIGTVNCLEAARKYQADVIFLSTSRVYPYEKLNALQTEEQETRFERKKEQNAPSGWSMDGIDTSFSLDGAKSLYGATKLCSEILLREYCVQYGIRGIINRCGVLAGPWQFGKVDQGVFTLWMLMHYFKKSLKYIGYGGTGKQVRDLLHITDLFTLVDQQLQNMDKGNGNVYNVGGGNASSLSLQETTNLCKEITGNHIVLSSETKTRPADLKIYITDNQKVKRL